MITTRTLDERDRDLAILAAGIRSALADERGILTDVEAALLRDAAALLDSIPALDR